MIACLDVDYREPGAIAACVLFRDWADETPVLESTVRIDRVEDYQPGRFYRRELPYLLALQPSSRGNRLRSRPVVGILGSGRFPSRVVEGRSTLPSVSNLISEGPRP